MEMEQMNLYDYFGKEEDPLFVTVSNINKGETLSIGEHEITLNPYGIYEISSRDEVHESKGSLEACYKYLVDNQIFLE